MAAAMGTLNLIGQSILSDKGENYPATEFIFDGVSFLLAKESGSRIQGAEYRAKQGSIQMPDRLEVLGLDSELCVEIQVLLVNRKYFVNLAVLLSQTLWFLIILTDHCVRVVNLTMRAQFKGLIIL